MRFRLLIQRNKGNTGVNNYFQFLFYLVKIVLSTNRVLIYPSNPLSIAPPNLYDGAHDVNKIKYYIHPSWHCKCCSYLYFYFFLYFSVSMPRNYMADSLLLRGCSHIMSAKNGGGSRPAPPPPLSVQNQKLAYPPSPPCQKKSEIG